MTLRSQTEAIVYFMMFMDFIMNTNLVTLVFPLTALLYSMLDNPRPSHRYWNGLTFYLLVIITLKFIDQLPIYCNTPAYSAGIVYECKDYDLEP